MTAIQGGKHSFKQSLKGHKIRHIISSTRTDLIKDASSLHTPFLELERMITYRVSIGEWKIYYCHVAPMGVHRHIFTEHFHGLPQICGPQVWNPLQKWRFLWLFFVCFSIWQDVLDLSYIYTSNIFMGLDWYQDSKYVT